MKYNAIPGVIYTNPEVAGVGETEQSAKAKGLDVTIKKVPMQFAGRYVAENEGGNGFIKIIVDNKWNKLVGVHMITNYSSEIIWGADAVSYTHLDVYKRQEPMYSPKYVDYVDKKRIESAFYNPKSKPKT